MFQKSSKDIQFKIKIKIGVNCDAFFPGLFDKQKMKINFIFWIEMKTFTVTFNLLNASLLIKSTKNSNNNKTFELYFPYLIFILIILNQSISL